MGKHDRPPRSPQRLNFFDPKFSDRGAALYELLLHERHAFHHGSTSFHLLHHLPHRKILVDKFPHFTLWPTGASRNSLRPRAVYQSRLPKLLLSHRLDNHSPRFHFLLRHSQLLLRKTHTARNHLENFPQWSHLPKVLHLIIHVFQSKTTFHELFDFRLGNLHICLLHFLKKRVEIAHSQQPSHKVCRDELLQILNSFSCSYEFDLRTGPRDSRERSASLGGAVHLCQQHRPDRCCFVERASLSNRLLSNRRVDCQYDLVGLHGRSNSLHLVHQVPLIPVSSRSIDNYQVGLLLSIVVETVLRDILRLLGAGFAVYRNIDCGC